MYKIIILIVLLIGIFIVQGCTSAGPFVTDIAFDGAGDLVIMKNTVVFNSFFGTVSSGDKTQTVIIKTPK